MCDRGLGRWLEMLPAALVVAAVSAARAETVTVDFDPPTFQAGQVLGAVGDVGFFGNPTVFRPAGIATQSSPQALHTPAWCDTPACPSGAYGLSIILHRPATTVSVRVGSEAPPVSAAFCFPEGTDCGVWARLVGTHDGTPIADSRDVKLYDASTGQAAIIRELSVSDPYGRINGVVVWVGRGTFSHDGDNNPGRVQIDHLVVDFVDGAPPTPPPPPAAPSLQILQPSAPVSAPYRFEVSGTWSAPGGLYALCLRLNEAAPTSSVYCANNVVFGPNNSFAAELYAPSLLPTGNVVNAAIYDLAGQRGTTSFPLQAGLPPKPSISLTSPKPGLLTPGGTAPVTAAGFVVTSGPPAGFCVLVGVAGVAVSTPPLSACQDQRFVAPNGNFSNVPITLSPGTDDIWAFVYDAFGQVGQTVVHVTVPGNLRITGVEISQGSQTLDAPNASAPYQGIQLVQGQPTVVRVFADAAAGGPFPNVNATLEGFAQTPAGERSLGTLLPDNGARTLMAGGPVASLDQRADPNGGYVFTLPTAWTQQQGALRLQARVNNPLFGATIPECAGCDGDNVVDVTNISFRQPFAQELISPVAIRWTNGAGQFQEPDDPEHVFAVLRALAPFTPANLSIQPYVAEIDATTTFYPGGIGMDGSCDETCKHVVFALTYDVAFRGQPGNTIGISTAGVRGLTSPVPVGLGWQQVSIASTTFNIESLKLQVAHEMFHQFHYLHASSACGDASSQPWEVWPPDHRGRLQGVGLDRRVNSGGTPGTYWVVVDRAPPNDAYDIMSYCAPGGADWLSPRNWGDFGKDLPSGTDSCVPVICSPGGGAPAGAAGTGTRVLALKGTEGGWSIVSVGGLGRPAMAQKGTAATSLQFVARDRTGALLARVAAEARQASDDGKAQLAGAEIPATDLGSIALEVDGKEVARRTASAHAPSLEPAGVPALKPDIHTGQVRVNWRTADADGDWVGVRVDYAADGKNFRTIGWSARPDGMTLPPRLFSAAKAARLRLTASDGMNEVAVTSAPFASPGAPPSVAILEPSTDVAMLSTGVLNLTGSAFDDRGQAIAAKDLRWTLDGSPWGEGGAARTLIQPAPGRHVITFQAKDSLGRQTVSQRVVDVADGGIKRVRVPPKPAAGAVVPH